MVNKNVVKEVMGMMDKYSNNPRIRNQGLDIIMQSCKYKQNQKKLLDDKVLEKVLDLGQLSDEEELKQLKIMNNFSKTEQGQQIMQQGQKGIEKAVELMMKHNND